MQTTLQYLPGKSKGTEEARNEVDKIPPLKKKNNATAVV